jgi:hypothetical protein
VAQLQAGDFIPSDYIFTMPQTLDLRYAFPSGIRHVARIFDPLDSEHSSEESEAVRCGRKD